MNTNGTLLTVASNEWRNRPADQRFETLQQLRDAVHARRMRSRATDLGLSQVKASADGDDIIINSGIAPSKPSNWAFTQFAGLLKAPAAYLRSLSTDLAVENLNYGLEHGERDAVKFMTVADADGGRATLQAVTSPTYGRIWDADVAEGVQRIVDKSDGKFYNPKAYDIATGQPKPSGLYASDHDVFIFMIDGGSLLDAGPRAKLNRGFIAWNSETGARTFGLMTFLFNQVCGNHLIYGARDINQLIIRHSKNGPTRFDIEACPTLQAYANSSAAEEITVIKRAQEYLLPTADGGLESLVMPFKLTRGEIKEAVETANREEGDCRTLWQFVQGATAYARGFEFIDARTDLERRAGRLLDLVSGK